MAVIRLPDVKMKVPSKASAWFVRVLLKGEPITIPFYVIKVEPDSSGNASVTLRPSGAPEEPT